MILRVLSFFKHIVLSIFRIIFWVLRCGRRKKVKEADDGLAMTDVVIGDAPSTNFPNYNMNSSLMNGYEVPAPGYYDKAQEQQRHPYQSQVASPPPSGQYHETTQLQMESWDQWDDEESSNVQNQQNNQIEPEEQEELNFFADMEPSVKVKKIFVKKKHTSTNEWSNRLAVDQDLDFKTSSELDAWQDEDKGEGWADDDVEIDDIDTDKIAQEGREVRKQERIQKSEEQKKLRLAKKSKQHRDPRLGMKVSA